MALTDELVPLVDPGDLVGLPGGPFPDRAVEVAGSTVRRLARWHIAPIVQETWVLDHDGGDVVHLPTKRVTELVSVRVREHGAWVDRTASVDWSSAGMLSGVRAPRGFRVLEVTVQHGYESCPEDLLPVVASRAKRAAIQESLAGRSVVYGPEPTLGLEAVLQSYRLAHTP